MAAQTRQGSAEAGAKPDADPLFGKLSFTSGRDPIAVSSDSLEFDYRSRILRYKGNVVATQADMRMESASLTVSLTEGPEARVKDVTAVGQVRLTKGQRWATAGRAVFDQDRRTVTLSEQAVVHDGGNEVSGNRIVVFLDEGRSVVESGRGGRVKAVLYPQQASEPTP